MSPLLIVLLVLALLLDGLKAQIAALGNGSGLSPAALATALRAAAHDLDGQ